MENPQHDSRLKNVFHKVPEAPLEYVAQFYERSGEKSIEFNPQDGVLHLAMSPSSLENLLEKEGPLPTHGKDIKLKLPRTNAELYMTFRKVKEIRMMERSEYECHWDPKVDPDKVPEQGEPHIIPHHEVSTGRPLLYKTTQGAIDVPSPNLTFMQKVKEFYNRLKIMADDHWQL